MDLCICEAEALDAQRTYKWINTLNFSIQLLSKNIRLYRFIHLKIRKKAERDAKKENKHDKHRIGHWKMNQKRFCRYI